MKHRESRGVEWTRREGKAGSTEPWTRRECRAENIEQ
jgi:hypothetical protein